MSHQQGFTFTEILVAVPLGLLISMMLIKLLLNQNYINHYARALNEVQENSRIALQLMTNDLNHAGFWGCLPRYAALNNNVIPFPINSNEAVHIIEPSDPHLPTSVIKKIKPNSQALLIEYLDHSYPVIRIGSDEQTLIVYSDQKFIPPKLIVITDCQSLEIHHFSHFIYYAKTHEEAIHLNSPTHLSLHRYLQMGTPSEILYFISDSDVKNNQRQKISVLHRRDLLEDSRNPDEIAEGIIQLRFRLSNPIQTVSIYLLAESKEPVLLKSKIYNFPDFHFFIKELRWISPFYIMVTLRNL
jgi:hypothetical protein